MQESGYSVSAVSESQDYGLGQININTIRNFRFDRARLLSDVEYSVEASCIVLADFKARYGHRESEYWSRYNAGNTAKRAVYKSLVNRHM